MKLNIYAIFDKAVNAYMRPFTMQADGQAVRVFGDMANDPNHEIGKHPADYQLFRIGDFDDGSAELEQCPPKSLASGHELVNKEQ